MHPKHIVVVLSDQHRADCLGCAGHPLVRTPYLDRLAAGGIRFSQAFTPIPLCVPARTSFLTGEWPSRTGVLTNWDAETALWMEPGTPTWSSKCAEAGRPFDYVGRWHVHPEKDPRHFGFASYVDDHGYAAWRTSQGLSDMPRKQGWEGTCDRGWFFGEVDPSISPEQSKLAWTTDAAIEVIEDRLRAGKAIHLRMDTLEPHLPNIVPEPYASMYPPEEIEPWPSFGETFAHKPRIQAMMLEKWGIGDWSWREWAPVVSRYLGEITLLDAQIGRLIRLLEEADELDDTLFVYTSDHGDLCGAHRMIDKLHVLYDDVLRVPLILHWPGGLQGGGVCDAFTTSVIDLAATLCDCAGAPRMNTPACLAANNLLDLADGRLAAPEDIYACAYGNQFGLYSQRMVRDHRWKYIWNPMDKDELYDLNCDPGELNNMVDQSAVRAELARLRHRLLSWLDSTGDPLLSPWNRGILEDLPSTR